MDSLNGTMPILIIFTSDVLSQIVFVEELAADRPNCDNVIGDIANVLLATEQRAIVGLFYLQPILLKSSKATMPPASGGPISFCAATSFA